MDPGELLLPLDAHASELNHMLAQGCAGLSGPSWPVQRSQRFVVEALQLLPSAASWREAVLMSIAWERHSVPVSSS